MIHEGDLLQQHCVADLGTCKHRCAVEPLCTGFTFYGDEFNTAASGAPATKVCALSGAGAEADSVFADGPFAQLPGDGLAVDLGRPPRLYENTEYNESVNYATVLGLDSVTHGFYQPLSAEDDSRFSRQGFVHTCGATDADAVTIRADGPSRIFTVRVWKRCDCCEHRAIGLQVHQQVDAGDGATEWQA